MSRIYNFAAGPSTLPLPALEEASAKLVDFGGTGMSLIEMSHRGKIYDAIHNETVALLRELFLIPEDFHVLFLQGGATMQFGMVPMAFLKEGAAADFVLTGSWALRAVEDARLIGETNIIWDGKDDNYTRIPSMDELTFNRDAAYVHLCSNETIGGIQWQDFPDTGDVPLIVDMSSDIISRPLPWDRLDMVFAGTQKNLAPAGMALVLIRKDFARKARTDLPAYFRYDLHIDKNSLYNTPPTFVVWMTNLTLKWIKSIGGMAEIERRRKRKAGLLYDMIDGSGGYYRNPVEKASRSQMNVVWRLPDEELEKKFLAECDREGLNGLKGHRDVGGIRASLYNAMPVEGAEALADFMKRFMEGNG
ncbi:MAG TPA: 3-phosphoserine/phosphohydroxythreonine transaminase [Spirochaetota bacterium]|nr:3-phosphoserine/phosphohydroxythreonine transaminase [Spirochaetota bacterium]HQP48684.1 3-phosphoserine/phosphohydroxythreonine transaminase [Spirochaetota bacterium]